MSNTWLKIEKKRNVTFRVGENEKEIVLIKKQHWWFTQNVKAILGEFQHALVVGDIGRKKIRNAIRKTHAER